MNIIYVKVTMAKCLIGTSDAARSLELPLLHLHMNYSRLLTNLEIRLTIYIYDFRAEIYIFICYIDVIRVVIWLTACDELGSPTMLLLLQMALKMAELGMNSC